MKHNKPQENQETGLFLIPNHRLQAIEEAQAEILAILKGKDSLTIEALNYVDEKKAIQLVGKRATWFWQMRTSGKLKYTKVGSKVFYSLDELKRLVSEGGSK